MDATSVSEGIQSNPLPRMWPPAALWQEQVPMRQHLASLPDPPNRPCRTSLQEGTQEDEGGANTRRLARARAEAERSGSRKSWKRKNAPPIVEEGVEFIRNRRGQKARISVARNFTLKPMRSIASMVRPDPARLERIRLKEITYKDLEMHMSSSSNDWYFISMLQWNLLTAKKCTEFSSR